MSELRAHFPERDAYLDRLAQHYADGLLDDAGFEARRDLLLQATSHGEMLRAFDGLPQPRYRESFPERRPQGVGRRALIAGGIAAVGIVGVGSWLAGAFAPTAYTEATMAPAETYWGPGPGEVPQMMIPFDGVDETFFTLQERGLTLISAFSVTSEAVTGTAMSPRAPGDLRTFTRMVGKPVIVAEGVEGQVPPAVELERLHHLMLESLDRAVWEVGGDYSQAAELVFTERNNPTVRVTVVRGDGTLAGTAQYDLDGNLIALEENQ